ncbi:hypothetical protein ACJZ2D_002131 [Fusarium nematophilum]
MSVEYRDQGHPLAESGVRYLDAPGYPLGFAQSAKLSNDVAVPAGVTVGVQVQFRQSFLKVERNLIAAGAAKGWKSVYKVVKYQSSLEEEHLQTYARYKKQLK